MNKLTLLASALVLSGCSVHSAILADSAAGAALSSAAIKYGALYLAKSHSKSLCNAVVKSIYSASYGAAVNNITIDYTDKNAALGFGAGVFAFTQSEKPADKFCR